MRRGRLQDLGDGDTVNPPDRRFVAMAISTLGHSDHPAEKVFAPKYPLAQLLLEGIYRIDKTLVDVPAVGSRSVLAAELGVPAGVQLIVLDPVNASAPRA